MVPAQSTLSHRRLWLGITNVGFWVLAAGGGLAWLRGSRRPAAPGLRSAALVGAGAVAVQAAFDFVGGALLVPAPRPAPADFLRRWARGAFGHSLVLAVVGLLSAASLRLTGGFSLGILLATAGLAAGRRALLRVIGGAAATPVAAAPPGGGPTLAAAVADPAFTGGIVGFGPRAASLLPAAWLAELSPEELAAEATRRRWQVARGLPGRSLVLVLAWNLLGAALGARALGPRRRPPGAALLGHACWMTLWAFGGLLVLPSLSRRAVFAADQAAARAGRDPRRWIDRFPDLVGEDGGPNAAVQAIFYPVPSAARRRRQLGRPVTGFVPGNLARNNLYYSWATLTLLGRAVHCNVGRPALWVFPPTA